MTVTLKRRLNQALQSIPGVQIALGTGCCGNREFMNVWYRPNATLETAKPDHLAVGSAISEVYLPYTSDMIMSRCLERAGAAGQRLLQETTSLLQFTDSRWVTACEEFADSAFVLCSGASYGRLRCTLVESGKKRYYVSSHPSGESCGCGQHLWSSCETACAEFWSHRAWRLRLKATEAAEVEVDRLATSGL